MNYHNSLHLTQPRPAPRATVTGVARTLLPTLIALALFCAPAARAGTSSVTSSNKVPFNSAIFIDKCSAPEWVYFSGEFTLLTRVVAPTNTCSPATPCTQIAAIAEFTTGIPGIGQTSGQKYLLIGAFAVKRYVQVPGVTVVQQSFVVILPRFIRPLGCIAVTVPLKTIIAFNSTGGILQAAVPPVNLGADWQAEGTAADALGANNGTLSNPEPVSFVPGKIGLAFHFENTGFIEVPSSPALEPATVSVAAWVRAGVSPGPFAHALSKGASACDGSSYALYTGASGGMQFYVSDGVNSGVSADCGTGIWDGNWHFIAGTFDGATVRIYVDGAEVGTGTPAPITINYNLPTNDNFFIGAYRGSCELRFRGDLDEIQLFGRGLTAAEVLGLYNASK